MIGKKKLDSIDKVVDLIRTVSRDISPDTPNECDCLNEFYQEKENQTEDSFTQALDDLKLDINYPVKLAAQQAEIEQLNNELEQTVFSLFFFSVRL